MATKETPETTKVETPSFIAAGKTIVSIDGNVTVVNNGSKSGSCAQKNGKYLIGIRYFAPKLPDERAWRAPKEEGEQPKTFKQYQAACAKIVSAYNLEWAESNTSEVNEGLKGLGYEGELLSKELLIQICG